MAYQNFFSTLISAEQLAVAIDRCVVVDCRHDLFNHDAGFAAYEEGHIPGAFFLHQDDDIAGEKTGMNGRHPLPNRDDLEGVLQRLGLNTGQQLVTYDGQGGMYAGRLWWMAKWLGHQEVAVLDGGIAAWIKLGLPQSKHSPNHPKKGSFKMASSLVGSVSAANIEANLAQREFQVLDARAAERYRGEVEPLDPRAGHIPGALNRPFQSNLRPDGMFKPAEVLRAEFTSLLAGKEPSTLIHQCGSGVTACHNLLAMEYAGLNGSLLYPGSWSEWSSLPERPIATGAQGG
jgi:thiosulfate/3-mercaptopyruvate sulfurtransferase